MKKRVLFLMIILPSLCGLKAQDEQNFFLRFNNEAYINNYSQLRFDIEIKVDAPDLYLHDVVTKLHLNLDQFGDTIDLWQDLTIDLIGIADDPGVPGNPLFPLYDLNFIPDTIFYPLLPVLLETKYPDKIGGETFTFLGTEYPYNIEVPMDWVGLLRIIIRVENCSFPAGIYFDETTGAVVSHPDTLPLLIDSIHLVNDLMDLTCPVGFSDMDGKTMEKFTIFSDSPGSILVTLEEEYAGEVTIFDLTGKMVAKRQVSGTTEKFSLRSGLYLVHVRGSDGAWSKKVIVR